MTEQLSIEVDAKKRYARSTELYFICFGLPVLGTNNMQLSNLCTKCLQIKCDAQLLQNDKILNLVFFAMLFLYVFPVNFPIVF